MIPLVNTEGERGVLGVRLAVCSVGELFGGVERHILEFCLWLVDNGMHPMVILYHDRELANQLRRSGIQPIIIKTNSSFDLRSIGELGDMLAKNNIQVVHAHGYRAVVNCALARRIYPFEMVRTVHGMVEPVNRPSLRVLKSMLYTWLERFIGRKVDAVVTYVSDDLRTTHKKGDRGLRTVTIYNGIQPLEKCDFTPPGDWNLNIVNFVVLGRLSLVKGIGTLVDAIASLESDQEFQVSILGAGPLAVELQAKVVSLGLENKVRFLGFRRDAYNFLANADALLMPSLHEGLPYSVLEAMSLGTPILASAVGGIAEVLTDDDTALLFPSKDPVRIKSAMQVVLGNTHHMQEIAKRARIEFEQNYRVDVMASSYLTLYRSLVGEGLK